MRYFRKDDREVEFVVEMDAGVVSIEVKAGNGSTASLDALLRQEEIPFGYKLIDGNVGVAEKKITLPHYMAMFV